ncbi:MAG TPA: phenylalanine--tRNA ligase subunit beta [Chitinophagaceae bacterium]|nr:phenylalanine--tRNA ligase subunit beta [Chitinophagaceae bacterium]
MTISYKWLSEYLPVTIEPERLARILNSIGLEVEKFEKYEEIKGGLKGLLIGEVISTEKHPNADKLSLNKVSIGNGDPLQIVCGAPNVAAGQKVIVATAGTTIYPVKGEPLTMRVAKIRNVESQGMICAEDEIGIGTSHEGIIVLDQSAIVGTAVSDLYQPVEDWIFELGITPNRMDAMSHLGVAKDVCVYLSHHDNKEIKPIFPFSNGFKADNLSLKIEVNIENKIACRRYSGLSISGVTIKASPRWLQQKLKAIGLRPINNIVDISNFIQHETGQPLHIFDAKEIKGGKVIVKNLPEGTKFITLDEKERKLSREDLMICDTDGGICIAGVFGGLHSGVTEQTKNIFIESAWFNPLDIRKTSFRHGLRTDAATRFEKNIDISNTVTVLKRAALMIKELCGGLISSDIIDVYPQPVGKTEVPLKFHFLKKLSGKNYHPDSVKNILSGLGFEIVKNGIDEIRVAVPFSKPDIFLAADLAEEILRIDGLDNIDIPTAITITPSVEENYLQQNLKEKTANFLVGSGYCEIMTNSITNAAYFSEEELQQMVKMINSLSAELNVLRPSLLETSLETVARNLNHKNNDLKLFEFGKSYFTDGPGNYRETEQLCLVISGHTSDESWNQKSRTADFYYLKGALNAVFELSGIKAESIEAVQAPKMSDHIVFKLNGQMIAVAGEVNKNILLRFGIKQPVFFASINWALVTNFISQKKTVINELPRFPAMQRDISMLVPKQLAYDEVEKSVYKLKLGKLQKVKLFDIFESEKLGADKKSLAVNFTFLDTEKTLTDKEIDEWMIKIMVTLEKDLAAEIRK